MDVFSYTENLAVSLMKKHGIWEQGWRFRWDNAKRRYGVCRYRSKTIGLSKNLVSLNTVEKTKDTILHEIAHAIAGHKAGHGWEWKQVCIRIGAKPERCYSSSDTNTPKLKYYAVCGGCGMEHQRSKKISDGRKISCKCQGGKSWNDRILLEYKQRY